MSNLSDKHSIWFLNHEIFSNQWWQKVFYTIISYFPLENKVLIWKNSEHINNYKYDFCDLKKW